MVLGRAVVLGLAGFGSAVVSHLVGGGLLPAGLVLLALTGISVAAASVLTRVELTTGRIVVAVVVAQSGWHAVLSAMAGHDGATAATTSHAVVAPPTSAMTSGAGWTDVSGTRTGSLHDAYEAGLGSVGATPGSGDAFVAHQLAHLADQGGLMVLAHLVGAVALGIFLARGEAALWHLLDGAWLAAGSAVAVAAHLGVPNTPRLPAQRPQIAHAVIRIPSPLGRRGPPFLLAA